MSDTIHDNSTAPEITIDTDHKVITDAKTESRLKSAFNEFINALRTEKIDPIFGKISTKLKAEFKTIDASWTERYGERYQQFKQYWQTAQTRYSEEKSKVDAGETTPVDRKQAKWEANFGEAGGFVARQETLIKQQLLEYWQTRKTQV